MKRYLSLFLAIVMLFGLMGTAFAEGNTPTFVVSEETAAPGDEVRVTISIENNTEVASIQLEPQYDHDVLEWTDVEQGDYTGTWNPRVDKGFVNWFGINGHNVSNDGIFATLVFKVSENAAAGDYAVTVTYDEDNVYDEDEENVYFAIQAGKVTVTGEEPAEGPTFVISEATAAPGDEVRVTISIENNTEVAGIQLEPQYDHDVLEWTDVEQGDYTGTWNPRVDKGFVNWFGINGHNVSNDGVFATLVFKVSENAAAGDYAVTVTYDEDNVYDEDEENVYFAIQDGKVTVTAPETAYYLVGSMNEWSVDEAYKFVPNPANSDEYMLSITLAEGDEFKAVAATGTTPTAWYPDGLGNNYIVGANQAGDVTVYFRPDGRGGDGWHYGYLYIAPRGPEFKTQKLLLAAKIGVRFYVYLPEIDGYEYEGVEFTIEGKGGENSWVPFNSDLPTNIQGWYGFTYYVNTIQMADKITATLKYYVNDEEKTLVKEYHVMDYFEAFDVDYENNPTPYDEVEGLVDMVKATADLGHYVQAYLDEARSEWSVPTDHADMEKYYTTYEDDDLADANEAVADHALKVEGSCSDIKSLGYALYMDSAMMIRVTIVPNSGFTGTFNATVDGETVEVRKISRVKYAVEIPNVMAHQLSTKHTIVIGTDDGGSYTLTGSGLSFVKMMLDAYEGNETAVNAAVAVYRYSKFADDLKEGASEAKQN